MNRKSYIYIYIWKNVVVVRCKGNFFCVDVATSCLQHSAPVVVRISACAISTYLDVYITRYSLEHFMSPSAHLIMFKTISPHVHA